MDIKSAARAKGLTVSKVGDTYRLFSDDPTLGKKTHGHITMTGGELRLGDGPLGEYVVTEELDFDIAVDCYLTGEKAFGEFKRFKAAGFKPRDTGGHCLLHAKEFLGGGEMWASDAHSAPISAYDDQVVVEFYDEEGEWLDGHREQYPNFGKFVEMRATEG